MSALIINNNTNNNFKTSVGKDESMEMTRKEKTVNLDKANRQKCQVLN